MHNEIPGLVRRMWDLAPDSLGVAGTATDPVFSLDPFLGNVVKLYHRNGFTLPVTNDGIIARLRENLTALQGMLAPALTPEGRQDAIANIEQAVGAPSFTSSRFGPVEVCLPFMLMILVKAGRIWIDEVFIAMLGCGSASVYIVAWFQMRVEDGATVFSQVYLRAMLAATRADLNVVTLVRFLIDRGVFYAASDDTLRRLVDEMRFTIQMVNTLTGPGDEAKLEAFIGLFLSCRGSIAWCDSLMWMIENDLVTLPRLRLTEHQIALVLQDDTYAKLVEPLFDRGDLEVMVDEAGQDGDKEMAWSALKHQSAEVVVALCDRYPALEEVFTEQWARLTDGHRPSFMWNSELGMVDKELKRALFKSRG